ncbi:fluoride efflux transporter FluC [Streptomyces sp. CA-253872]|uniref:fluoride efflux transporter FluC n=1 Tax=Streptomyces sp. CA-253872 TaxID=3240067 RepID=UPI003D8BE927
MPVRSHPDHADGPHLPVVAVVALGGAVGAVPRYGVSRVWRNGSDASLLWRTGAAAFPWTTLVVNAVGCLVMGVPTVARKERLPRAPRPPSPLLTTVEAGTRGVLGAPERALPATGCCGALSTWSTSPRSRCRWRPGAGLRERPRTCC